MRLFEFLLQRAQTADELDDAQSAIDSLRTDIEGRLSRNPFIYRKSATSPFVRELVLPFRSAGYIALCEIEGGAQVNILAVRHQLEDDWY